VQASLTQLLETGLLHGDPHPGNLLLTPSGRLAYVDFGLLCRVKREHSRALEALMVHLTAERWLPAAADLRQLELLKPYTTDEEVAAALKEKMAGRSLLAMRLKDIAGVFVRLAVQFRFELPPYYTLLLRSLATLEGIALTADPRYIYSGCVWRTWGCSTVHRVEF
jgi:aarF domain-containing kinase